MTSVAIVDDHRMLRAGIERVLADSSGVSVVASVDAPEHLDPAADQPDIVILNPTTCPEGRVAATVADLSSRSAVLIMADASAPVGLAAALRAGASGVVSSASDVAEFVAAVEAVARGAFYLAAGLAATMHGELDPQPATPDTAGLARREIETLRLVAHGYTHRQIARRLGLTEATVNTYVKRIRSKLGVGNKAELTRTAIDLGFLSSNEARQGVSGVAPSPWAPSIVSAAGRSA